MPLSRDTCAADGGVEFGYRLVRKDGRVKFAGAWYQSDSLEYYVGTYIVMRTLDYWYTEVQAWKDYPTGRKDYLICTWDL